MLNIYSLDRFNKQCEYYNSLLDFVEKHCHSNRIGIDYEKYLNLENTVYSFVNDVMLGTLYIGKYEENTDNFDELDKYLDEIESFKNIEILDPACDKKHQFRNCLAHADFKFSLDEDEESVPYLTTDGLFVPKFKNNPYYIEIDNGNIRGKISYNDFWLIMGKYMDIANIQELTNIILLPQKLKLKTNSQLKNFIDDLSFLKINMDLDPKLSNVSTEEQLEVLLQLPLFRNSSPEQISRLKKVLLDHSRLYGNKDILTEVKDFDKKDKEFVYNYIKYLGLGTWENTLNEKQRAELLSDLFALNNGEYCNMFSAICFSNMFSILGQQYSNTELSDKLGHLFMEGPFLYADYVLGYSNYLLGYIRQNKFDENNVLPLKYKNINLNGINPVFLNSNEKKSQELMDEEISGLEITELKIEEALLQKNLSYILSKINYMNKKNGDPKKEERLQLIDEGLSNINVTDVINNISKRIAVDGYTNMQESELQLILNNLIKEHEPPNEKEKEVIEVLRKLINKYKDPDNKDYPIGELSEKWKELDSKIVRYTDSSNLFKHLRNSIEHGRYFIDYNPALIKKDFSKSYITFYDKDSKDSKDNNFTLRITLGRFYKLMEDFREIIKEQIENQNIEVKSDYNDFLKTIHLYGMDLLELLSDTEKKDIVSINKIIYELINEKQRKIEQGLRPTGQDFEQTCDEEVLIDAYNSSVGNELNSDLCKDSEIEQK